MTYEEYCLKRIKQGKRKGMIQGYPCFKKGACGFKRDSKIKSINKEISKIKYDFIDIGITIDENEIIY